MKNVLGTESRFHALEEESDMPIYFILTRVSPEIVCSPRTLEDLERKAMEQIRRHCPEV